VDLTVIIEPTAGNRFRASTGEPLPAAAEGATRAEALAKLEAEMADRLPDVAATRIGLRMSRPVDRIGLDESEWRDDPEALADWEAWLKTIEPLEYGPGEEAAIREFAARMREHNIDAVRRQMQSGNGG
jgi:hypothetical protein